MTEVTQYIVNRACQLLEYPKSKFDKVKSSLNQDEMSSRALEFFVSSTESQAVFIIANSNESFSVTSSLPDNDRLKRKFLVVYRAITDVRISGENMRKILIFVEMTRSLIQQLEAVCESVYRPLITGIPGLSASIQQKLFGFVSSLSLTRGLISDKTVLPLPPNSPSYSAVHLTDPGIKDHIHELEEFLVIWSKQIRNAVARQSESIHDWTKFPEPKSEIDFWIHQADDLSQIQTQLNHPTIHACLRFLEKFNSKYPAPFHKLMDEIVSALEEATDNAKYLSTLSPLLVKLSSDSVDFDTQLESLFEPLLHYILLIWKHSRFYKSPSRLVVMFRLVCNSIIKQCQKFVAGSEIFSLINNDETPQALSKVNRVLNLCHVFQDKYELFKGISEQQGASGAGGWRVQSRAVFEFFDEFRDRFRDLSNFLKTVIQYFRMEKIEIGGTRGTLLTSELQRIVTQEFRATVLAKFQSVEYDVVQLDQVARQKFDEDYFEFKRKVRDMDKRICFLIGSALQSMSGNVSLGLRLTESFEGIWDRPLFADEFEKCFKKLVDWYREDLKAIHSLFMGQRSLVVTGATTMTGTNSSQTVVSPLGLVLPPISRAIYWARTLTGRANEPLNKLEQMSKNFPQSSPVVEEFKMEILKFNQSFNSTVDEFIDQIYVIWEEECLKSLPLHLSNKLLLRLEGGNISLNFHPAILSTVIREVKFIEWFEFTVPKICKEVFDRRKFLRSICGEIDSKIVTQYNTVIGGLLEVERPLIQEKIAAIDKLLTPGLNEIDWTSDDKASEFVAKVAIAIGDVAKIYNVLRDTMKRIGTVLEKWASMPLLEKKNKPATVEEFDSILKATAGARMVQISDDAKELYKWVRESNEAVRISRQSVYWKSYLEFLNVLISEGFTRVVDSNMGSVVKTLEGNHRDVDTNATPIIEVCLRLDMDEEGGEGIVFDPPFRSGEDEDDLLSVVGVLNNLTNDSFSVCGWITRLPVNTATSSSGSGGEDFVCEVTHGKDDLREYVSVLGDLIDQTEQRCESVRASFKTYEYLWQMSDSATDSMHMIDLDFPSFVDPVSKLKWPEIMSMVGIDCTRVGMVDIAAIGKELDDLAQTRTDISSIKGSVDIDWIRVNSVSLKHDLMELIDCRERESIAIVQGKLSQLIALVDDFMHRVSNGFGKPLDGLEEALYTVMTDIKDVRLSSEAIRLMIEPIKEMIGLLKRIGQPVSDEALQFVDHFTGRWDGIIKAALNEREKILPFQNKEMENIKAKIAAFAISVTNYRIEFISQNPFEAKVDSDEAMDVISTFESRTTEMLLRVKELNNLELLFDLTVSKYSELNACVEESHLLRIVWSEVAEIREKFSEWESILWDEMDADDLILAVRDIGNRLKSQIPKEVKSWGVYTYLMGVVKNMSTVLPLISDLHTDTMRDRHWRSLMDLVGSSFAHSGAEFCLGTLLRLQLHRFADDVGEIVSQSAKEFKIEKKLGMMKNHWEKTVVELDVTSREDRLFLLPNLGEIIEVLENHSLEMLGIVSAGGKYIEFCKPLVDEWVGKMRTIDSVLAIWQKVQRNWLRLEPIFLSSEDIRAQLPEDTRRFEQVDKEWRELMNALGSSGSGVGIVDICCGVDGRLELLNRMNMMIEQCEKSLNDYLEEKRKIFPRFYFVSNQALLDILSNGNRPLKVAQYLGDCFDGIKTLEFVEEDDSKRRVTGMHSKDGEYVPFNEELLLDGPVEQYLVKLESHMRHQLRNILESAKTTADNWEIDKPREIWLRDYCAQLALVATQIVWTEEVSRVFEELESGSENAMKEYKKICDDRIEKLIRQVQQPLSADLRNKIITIITIDVHARDVVEKFVQLKLNESTAFQWQSQLKFSWGLVPEGAGSKLVSWTPADQKTCLIKICDWSSIYGYEYIGNCGRLVITPLTDRCYLTLTQALNLAMGAAPSGPAGTGKTETTKDLSRAIGLPVVVFNCSDQMTYMTMANVIRGLSSMGAWGCFDEFNRISLEVLSVVSTQVKSVLDAIKEDAEKFLFMDEDCKLVKTVGFFITMNPGYAGRNVLPESLSSQFRSCAMVVPDLTFICENMLLSEGFLKSRQLARKFVCLYSLCKELLSAQMHYDWGLRAVKSLLRQAGSLKRADPEMDEYSILMRALRDFNTPKIVSEDLPIFLRLISDLFPGISAEPKNSVDIEQVVFRVTRERGLQPDKQFVTKVIGLLDILRVRHCCFIIGPSGSGKTTVWKVLMDALKAMGEDGQYETLNPKAITSDELYGIMTKSKEWKDGAISVIMRNMSKEINGYKSSHKHKWIILDGDIDARWIESMNTVMDDNKVLTLVSNERIPFTPSMRMLLEVQDMVHASPATVSRGGVLFINEYDIGWKPFVESWRDSKFPDNQIAQSTIFLLFNQYFETHIEFIRKNFAFICPINDMGFIQSICSFIDALLLTKEAVDTLKKSLPVEQLKILYEAFFVYGFMWSIGGAVAEDKAINYKRNFSNWLRSISTCKFPEGGEVFDYRFDPCSMTWVHWDLSVKAFVAPQNIGSEGGPLYQKIIVPNTDIERSKFNLQLNMSVGKPVLFCGVSGTGKSTIVRDFLSSTISPSDNTISASMNLNSYTDSFSLQRMLESQLDKRTGRTFGPAGNKKCIYFIDDLNMPFVDEYDTQSAAMLLFQLMSHKSIFDRSKLEERKEIVDVQFVSCMNPRAGSFMINNRLQRQYTVQSTYSPGAELIGQIFGQILGSHFGKFDSIATTLSTSLIQGTIDVLNLVTVSPQFLPSGRKFHYQFNLKEVSNIVQGLLKTSPSVYRGGSNGSLGLTRVWAHETIRVFSDRLVDKGDTKEMDKIVRESIRKNLPSFATDDVLTKDLIMTSFVSVHGGNDKHYLQVKDMQSLRKILEEKLVEYNETFPEMNLVLFDDAVEHVCRIARVMDTPCGHALLVGVGGSGKQSLARLACFIVGVDVVCIQVNQGYGLNEFKSDLQEFIRKAAVKPGTPQAILITDSQIVDERFLVYINDILSEGFVAGLFAKDEIDGLINGIRTVAKSVGVPDDRDALYEYLRDKVRKNLHVIFCHSPVGETLRVRARKFPALVSNTTIDVFHAWPRDALYNVAHRFLSREASADRELLAMGDDFLEIVDRLSNAMADIHLSIDDANMKYLATEGRFNYTTPKSFLELLSFYVSLLRSRRTDNQTNIERLEKGLSIMAEVRDKVSKLQEDLREKMIEVEEKKTAANALISQVTAASEVAEAEKAIADEEAAKTNSLAQQANEIKAKADAELEEAMPAMQAAKEAVNCLTKPAIQELKSLGKPPVECTEVTKAVLILLKNERKNLDWKSAQKMMNNPQQFLDEVVAFNADSIPEWVLEMVGPILSKPFFNYETMKGKSTAAAYLTNWVVNIIAYNRIYKKVAPLMAKVKEATAAKDAAESQLSVVLARVAEIEAKVASLQKTLNEAIADKDQVEREASSCESKLSLAKRLVDGLSDENVRWTKTVQFLCDKGKSLVSDLLIASAFVVYISPFSSSIRDDLWRNQWARYRQLVGGGNASQSTEQDPLAILASEADVATWRNEGLPADRMSIENASIITSCDRWPLLIDPQLQGLTWLKKRIPDLVIIQLNQPNWLQKLCTCIQNGGKLLIESIGQEIDPLLDPLLSRQIIRRGRSAFVIRLGGEEIEYDVRFKMFLQCKLSNPHFKPEIAAQCTIVNFIVTPDGLEDQILAMVVNVERPELEQEKVALVRKQNEFKVTLSQLEDDLLSQLSRADPATILDSTVLVEGLENTKRTAVDISHQVESAKKTESEINTMREKYRPVAQEGSMLFFLIIKLASIEHMYQYSLDSFVGFLFRAIARTPSFTNVEERVVNLVLSVRMTIFKWVNRGLFEKHKLVLSGMLAFKLLQRGGGVIKNEQFNRRYVEFLLGGNFSSPSSSKQELNNPLGEWLPNQYWKNVQALVELPGFELFAQNMEKDAPARFKDWFLDQNPEETKLPLDWKRVDGNMQKLLILKCLRPDRLSAGLASWITHAVPGGSEFVNCDSSLSFFDVLESSFVDSDPNTPIFFILSPGADPMKDVEKLGKKISAATSGGSQIGIHVVAMGQGQDVVAMHKLDQAHKDGDWIVLQNIHLMPKWCVELERRLDRYIAEGSGHPSFRIFLSADPSNGIPIGILERSIKLTNEPPQGIVANMKRAFASFSREVFDEKDSKVKQILMGLCHFHSVMLERKKFGPLGYNMNYPFSIGDLRDSALILFNTLENGNSTKIPWDDIKFLFGEIMYGGHIVDDWDRRLCKAYLDFYMTDDLVEGEMNMVPYGSLGTTSVKNPAIGGLYDGFLEYMETVVENPVVFGLHPNAEIGFRTSQSTSVLSMLNRLVDRPALGGKTDATESDGSAGILSGSEKAKKLCSDILEEIGGIKFNVEEISKSLSDEEKGPYQYVFLQECECMNVLVRVMVKTLSELQLGLKGELTMSEQMEQLMESLIFEQIPPRWAKVSFASNRSLLSWLVNLKERCAQLEEWVSDPSSIPKVVDLSKLFNPQSFLNAIKQTACQRQNCELDKLQVITEVTKKTEKSQVEAHSRDGAFVTGLFLEGARWDMNTNSLEESRAKEMFNKMPIINCKAGVVDETSSQKNTYICPTYCTAKRRPNYVFSAQLRSVKFPPSKWTLAGVALILDIGQ